MKREGVSAHILTTLDANAWLFNIRGRDIEFNSAGHLLFHHHQPPGHALYPIEQSESRLRQHLGSPVKIFPYQQFAAG